MRRLLTAFVVALVVGCTAAPPPAEALPLARELPVTIGDVRIDVGPRNEVLARDTGSGAILWSLAGGIEPARWHVLPSADARIVYIQQLRPRTPTYMGTQTLDLRTGARLAVDVKQELGWYENVVHWTALLPSGDLEMLVERSGRFEVRRIDGRDLRILAIRSVQSPVPPPVR